MYTLHIYIHMYACILLCGYLPNPLYRGPTAPSDKCLAISSANDVKRAKFMFQHDIDIFLYTDMYIHSPIQKHIMYVFTTSFVACACLRFSPLSQCECIFALCQGGRGRRTCNMTYWSHIGSKVAIKCLVPGQERHDPTRYRVDYHLHWQLGETW